MNKDALAPHRWGTLLWVAALAPAAELFPAVALTRAGKGSWLAPAAAFLVLLPLLFSVRRGSGELGSHTVGRIVGLLCAVWMELLVVLRLILCAGRLLWTGERDGAVWFFLLTLTALALWMGCGKLSVLGRAGQIYLVLLLAAAGLVLGLSLPGVRADRILPLWTQDAGPVLLTGLSGAGSLCWAVLPLLFLPAEEKSGKNLFLWLGGGCLLLTLAQLIVVGNLGIGLCRRSESAFFALTKSVGVEGAFQRVESLVSAVWMLSDLLLCVVLVRAIEICVRNLHPGFMKLEIGSFALLAAAGAALWGTRWGAAVEQWNQEWVWMGNLIACFAVAVGISVVKKTKTP